MAQEKREHSNDGAEPNYRVGTRTHVGLVRKRNEDYLQVRHTPNGLLMVVCDGMGGHLGGERASRLAVETFVGVLEEKEGTVEELLRKGVTAANNAVMEESDANPEYRGMGTTLVAVLLKDGLAKVINVGDSRAYLYRNGSLSRISHDHSLVGEMVARGEITEKEAAVHPRRNIITRALGSSFDVEPDIFPLTLSSGDQLLLASDGLHGMISDGLIRDAMGLYSDPAQACDKLVDLALTAGGSDNVSVALVYVGEGAQPVDSPTDPGNVASKKGASGGALRSFLIGALLILSALAALWFFWLRPPGEVDVVENDSSARNVQAGEYVDDPFLGADSSALFDSGGTGVLPPVIYDTSGADTAGTEREGIPGNDLLRPGDTIFW